MQPNLSNTVRRGMNKGLTIRMGQTQVNRWTVTPDRGRTHRPLVRGDASRRDGRGMYKAFRDKEDGCVKVVLRP
jgi:threonine dehydrogenase-like Zn-dependent dehydrogenase